MTDLFSVFWFDPDDYQHCERRYIDAESAVKCAHSLTRRPAARLGIFHRVIIVDADGYCCFEWKHGEGITFPTTANGRL